ncbi:PAS domain S-box-containing protein/diguanylate cyclase (GGDEF) domain-containing protein [Thiohalospira halophila DSM 15071]|uniref:PAS domain S-box-containing protein/diguanylate cyclase (GGDEF) domain-containing protein n=1 Tax=Thiohalospira halophila DSM 15071 TaxID=1123397 RepID=A0A1I1RJK5_9GAMM|nr:EAL domain-containing protein [Thiohalospira halophila]SFD34496.1 PAS domain S-box-containing protein/diguanylate cyclase (GGDEF) domain-containing protein [Thiohalospira halophila DSM 15071]
MERAGGDEAAGIAIHYRDLVENHPYLVVCYLPDSTILFANTTAREFFGSELEGQRWLDYLPEEDRATNRRELATYRPEAPVRTIENPAVDANGDPRWIEWTTRALFDADDRLTHLQSVGADVTERRAAREALEKSEAELAEAQRIAHLGSWTSDFVADEIRWSDEVYRIFGLQRDEWGATHEAFMQAVHPEDRERVQRAVETALDPGGPRYDIEHRIVRPDGEVRHVYQRGTVDFDAEGRPLRMVGTVLDITERRRAEQALDHLAHHDALTELPNRNALRERLITTIEEGADKVWAVIHLGLDRFRSVNEGLGHATGDALLQQAARRLENSLQGGEYLARVGGDEFAVLATAEEGEAGITATTERLLAPFRELFQQEGGEFFLPASAGVALYPRDADEADGLLQRAAAAMAQCKAEGGNGVRYHAEEMNERARSRVALEGKLRRAVMNREGFFLHYQPKVEAGTGRILGAEALLRWQDGDGEIHSPATFIPALEQTGLIAELGRWILATACAQCRSWQEAGLPPVRMAVNLAAPQFHDPAMAATLESVLAETGLAAGDLELEVTERMLMTDIPGVIRTLGQFREMGIKLALDDFGTGYSSLAYLRQFPMDCLKIDRAFINDLGNGGGALIRAILGLGESLGVETVAEGVEEADQADFLEHHGCRALQGFLFARPLTAEAFGELLADGGRIRTQARH